MRFIRIVFERLVDLSQLIGMLAIVAMMIHISIDVISRNLFNSPLTGTVTIVSSYYMVICAFASLALAERHKGHIEVEVFTELLPRNVQYHLAGWLYPISILAFAQLTYRTYFDAISKYRIGSFQIEANIAIPMWPSYAILPFGFGLMTLAVTFRFLDYLTGKARADFKASDSAAPGASID